MLIVNWSSNYQFYYEILFLAERLFFQGLKQNDDLRGQVAHGGGAWGVAIKQLGSDTLKIPGENSGLNGRPDK